MNIDNTMASVAITDNSGHTRNVPVK